MKIFEKETISFIGWNKDALKEQGFFPNPGELFVTKAERTAFLSGIFYYWGDAFVVWEMIGNYDNIHSIAIFPALEDAVCYMGDREEKR
jgi:hypothetical protein